MNRAVRPMCTCLAGAKNLDDAKCRQNEFRDHDGTSPSEVIPIGHCIIEVYEPSIRKLLSSLPENEKLKKIEQAITENLGIQGILFLEARDAIREEAKIISDLEKQISDHLQIVAILRTRMEPAIKRKRTIESQVLKKSYLCIAQ